MSRKSGQDFFLFLIGGALFAAGMFLFTNQVMVSSGYAGMSWGGGTGGGSASVFGSLFTFGVGRARVGYKAPEEIRLLDAMPLNGTGKTDRLALRQRVAEALQAH